MKIYPNKEQVALYVRSMGKLLKVSAIFTDDDTANAHMAKPTNNDGVVAVSGNLVILADVYDSGLVVKTDSKKRCSWSLDIDDGSWSGDCGICWTFPDGTPKENGCTCCPRCGQTIEEKA